MASAAIGLDAARAALLTRYRAARDFTELLAAPLSPEDQCVQSMPDASPTKWHRAHTTWFFETFVLTPNIRGYTAVHEQYSFLFNSYYDAVGSRHARAERALITRPSCAEVAAYRVAVDDAIERLVSGANDEQYAAFAPRIELGLHHEQQHQELLLMDVKHALSRNGFSQRYRAAHDLTVPSAGPARREWIAFTGGISDIGHSGSGFAFDNEGPAHAVLLQPFVLADRLVTAGEWQDFIADGGYARPELWLSDGWYAAQREGWTAPLYWARDGDGFATLTLDGMRAVDDAEPVVHVSHYEADAFARWSGARVPTEFEWEHAARELGGTGSDANTLDTDSLNGGPLHPVAAGASNDGRPRQMFGDVWEWTSSAYLPYPRFAPSAGAIGEYNGKFMSNQMVLRGGSCITPTGHVRASYRNFFYPHQRWMYSGLRLARDA